MSTTTKQLISEIERNADQLRERGFSPHTTIPVMSIIRTGETVAPEDVRVQVVCREGATVGMVVMPSEWQDPPQAGQKLAVPPDEDGWGLLDALLRAGVEAIQFWNVE